MDEGFYIPAKTALCQKLVKWAILSWVCALKYEMSVPRITAYLSGFLDRSFFMH